jgi:hypothetical protein
MPDTHLGSGLLEGQPRFRVFVIGHKISDKVQRRLNIPDRANIEAATYSQLVTQANRRLFRLKDRLASRYEEVTGNDLLNRILAEPHQQRLTNLYQ